MSKGTDAVVQTIQMEHAGPHRSDTGAPMARPSQGKRRRARPPREEERGRSWDGVHVAAVVILLMLIALALGCSEVAIKSSKVMLYPGGGGGAFAVVLGPVDPPMAEAVLRKVARPWAKCLDFTVTVAGVDVEPVPAKGEEPATVSTTVRGWFSCLAWASR